MSIPDKWDLVKLFLCDNDQFFIYYRFVFGSYMMNETVYVLFYGYVNLNIGLLEIIY